MERTARRGLGRHLSLLVSGGLVLLIGALGVVAGRTAGQQAREVHRDDRVILQETLAGLTEKYVLLTARDLQQELAEQGDWDAAPGSPDTVRRLGVLAAQVPALDGGVVLVSALGQPLGAVAESGAIPASTDPGWRHLRVTAMSGSGALPVSGVLDGGGTPRIAIGLPTALDDGSTGLLLGLWSIRASKLQEYVSERRPGQEHEVWVVDADGLAAAGPRAEALGAPLPVPALRDALGARDGAGVVDVREDGTDVVGVHAAVGATGWTSLTVQDAEAFEGALLRSSRNAQAAVVALLLSAGMGLVVLHRKRETALEAVALRDELTGLYNRRGWFVLAEHELERARRQGSARVLLFVDVDGLKQVNDMLGHREGDRAIADAACVLRSASRASDIVGRLGGDEFVLLLGDDGQAEGARRRLVEAVDEHNRRSGADFELRLSIGAEVWFPDDACTLAELVKRADAEMYADKTSRPERHAGLLRLPAQREAPDVEAVTR